MKEFLHCSRPPPHLHLQRSGAGIGGPRIQADKWLRGILLIHSSLHIDLFLFIYLTADKSFPRIVVLPKVCLMTYSVKNFQGQTDKKKKKNLFRRLLRFISSLLSPVHRRLVFTVWNVLIYTMTIFGECPLWISRNVQHFLQQWAFFFLPPIIRANLASIWTCSLLWWTRSEDHHCESECISSPISVIADSLVHIS